MKIKRGDIVTAPNRLRTAKIKVRVGRRHGNKWQVVPLTANGQFTPAYWVTKEELQHDAA